MLPRHLVARVELCIGEAVGGVACFLRIWWVRLCSGCLEGVCFEGSLLSLGCSLFVGRFQGFSMFLGQVSSPTV